MDTKKAPLTRYEKVNLSYGSTIVFEALNLTLNEGEITMFCGPNGCGKSTALKALRRLLKVRSGIIFHGANPIDDLSDKALAKLMSLLTQKPSAPDDLTVEQLIKMGRFAHLGYLGHFSKKDKEKVAEALSLCHLQNLVHETIGNLSGGQLQRVWLAMIIAQDSPTILLDEPTNHLDITHQIETLELIKKLNEKGRTIIVVMHDLNMAARYADRMILFKDGKVAADGTPEEVMQPSNIRNVFNIDCEIMRDNIYQKPMLIPYKLRPYNDSGNLNG